MDRLNKRIRQLHDTFLGLGSYLRGYETSLHDSGKPINKIYWEPLKFKEDGFSINGDHFRFIEYEDTINMRLWAFKK